MRTPGITEIYDIVSKMNGSFCSVDIFRELICRSGRIGRRRGPRA